MSRRPIHSDPLVIEKRVEAFLSGAGITRKETIVTAFSGGCDSLCLTAVLVRLGFSVQPVYVNHRLRSEQELSAELALNRANCKALGLTLTVSQLAEGEVERLAEEKRTSIEAAARELRYKVLSRYPLVATAHNFNDQAETVMMRLITGSSLLSLAGIRKKRGSIIRPLLECTRSEIAAYVDCLGLTPSHDSTNDELFCLRNKVRTLVMPKLNAEVLRTLAGIADNMSEAEARIRPVPSVNHAVYVSVSREALLACSSQAFQMSVFSAVSQIADVLISSSLLERIRKCASEGKSLTGRDLIITVTETEVRFYRPYSFACCQFEKGNRLTARFMLADGRDSQAVHLDPASLSGRAVLRFSRSSDEICIDGRTVRVSRLLSAFKCPYAAVLEDQQAVKAVFARSFGGRNRVCDSLRSEAWQQLEAFELEPVL